MKFKKLRQRVFQLKRAFTNLLQLGDSLDLLRANQGLILSRLNETSISKKLVDHEFRVFSQNGEDGILHKLVKSIEIKNKTFIEFGVEDFFESNLRFLMIKDNWSGFVIDGSMQNMNKLKDSSFYWKHQLESECAFITKDNINELLSKSEFDEDIGVLSIDIDGNDYYVLEAITRVKPRILVCEYNAVFGPTRKITAPYRPDFVRTRAHYSNLFFGASLAAVTHIANKKGYSLVGVNSACCNAFFIRNDVLNNKFEVLNSEQAFLESKARESRDIAGGLTFLSGSKRYEIIKGLDVVNVESNSIEQL
jgi:hypothetical protein